MSTYRIIKDNNKIFKSLSFGEVSYIVLDNWNRIHLKVLNLDHVLEKSPVLIWIVKQQKLRSSNASYCSNLNEYDEGMNLKNGIEKI